MSVLSKEIKDLLQQILVHDDGRITAEITFPKTFTGFDGHFPGKPVVPGVCKVLSVQALLEVALKKKVSVKNILASKFIALVTCDEALTVELRRDLSGGTVERVKALFRSADKKIADIQIEVSYAASSKANAKK